MWFYSPFRLFALVVAFQLLHHLVVTRPPFRGFVVRVFVLVAVAAAMAAPALQSAVLDPDDFFARTKVTSVFSSQPFGEAVREVRTSLAKHALMFNQRGDGNGRHNLPWEPMLDVVSGVLFVLGLEVDLGRWRDAALVMLLPGALTLPWEAPQSLRGLGSVPAAVMSITLALAVLWRIGRSSRLCPVRWGTPVLLSPLLAEIAYLNVDTYFGKQTAHPEVYSALFTDHTLIARDMVRQSGRGYDLMTSRQYQASLVIGLLTGGLKVGVVSATDAPHRCGASHQGRDHLHGAQGGGGAPVSPGSLSGRALRGRAYPRRREGPFPSGRVVAGATYGSR